MSEDFPELDHTDVAAPTLNDDLAKLAELSKAYSKLYADTAAAKTDLDTWRAHCYERMEDEDVESIRTGGHLFTRNEPTWYATVQDRTALHAWLKVHRPAALQTREVDKLLNRLVRDAQEDGRPLPPGLGGYPRKIVAVKK